MKALFLTLAVLAACPPLHAEPADICGKDTFVLLKGVGFYVDPAGVLDIEQAVKKNYSPLREGFLRFGHTSNIIWVRIETVKPCAGEVFLEIPKPIIEDVSLYRADGGRVVYRREHVGDAFPFENREIEHRRIVFRLEGGREPVTHYLRIASSTYINFPLLVWDRKAFERDETVQLAFIWLFVGFMSILAGYNLLNFFTIRDREHFFFFLISGGYAVHMVSWQGIGLQMIWPHTAGWTHTMHTSMASYFGVVLLLFSKDYLDIGRKMPLLSWLVYFTIAVITANLGAVFLLSSPALYDLMYVVTFITTVFITVFSLEEALRGSRHSWFYFISITVFLLGYGVYILYVWGIVKVPLIDQKLIPILAITQVVLFSLGLSNKLGDMIRRYKREARQERLRKEVKSQGGDSLPPQTEDKIRGVIAFIDENYLSDISREGLAAQCDMNTDYFSRVFKLYTGSKISDYINALRVRRAAEMLRATGDTILQISLAVGFENLRTFNRAFLREMKITPSLYRALHK